jgi:hypothetical protein
VFMKLLLGRAGGPMSMALLSFPALRAVLQRR